MRPFVLVRTRHQICLSPTLWITIGICPLKKNLQGTSSKILAIRKNIEGSALWLGIPLRLFLSDVFGGGSGVDKDLADHLWRRCIFWSVWSLRCSPLLFPSLWVHPTTLVWLRSCGIIVPGFPVWKGLRSSWRNFFATVGDVPRSLIRAFWFFRFVTEKG